MPFLRCLCLFGLAHLTFYYYLFCLFFSALQLSFAGLHCCLFLLCRLLAVFFLFTLFVFSFYALFWFFFPQFLLLYLFDHFLHILLNLCRTLLLNQLPPMPFRILFLLLLLLHLSTFLPLFIFRLSFLLGLHQPFFRLHFFLFLLCFN